MRYSIFGLFLMGLLTACSGEATPFVMPTVAQLPTVNAAVSTPPTPAPLGTKLNLPPSWTPNPSQTASATFTLTPTLSVTASATITDTPSPTPTNLPTVPPEERSRTSLVQDLALALTGLPPSGFIATPPPLSNAPTQSVIVIPTTNNPNAAVPTVVVIGTSIATTTCPYFPAGGFGTVFNTNPDVAALLGCPLGSPPDVLAIPSAAQSFQNGTMIWLNGNIYVLNSGGTFRQYIDTFQSGSDPETTSETPPNGLVAPVRGFLKLWTTNQDVRTTLGWATASEQGAQATVQQFSHGMMIWLPIRADILVFTSTDNLLSGTWRSFAGKF